MGLPRAVGDAAIEIARFVRAPQAEPAEAEQESMEETANQYPQPHATSDPAAVPLCVDLDGTLVRSDTLWETILQLARHRPAKIVPLLAAYFRGGRSAFKSAAVDALVIDPAALPYHDDVLAEIRRARASGRPVLLVTGANERLAHAVADHVGLFDGVIGSRPGSNNTGHDKADELSRRFGLRQFDYFGNSHADLKVWAQAHAAQVIGDERLKARAARLAPVTFHAAAGTVSRSRAIVQALRPSLWPLDFLVFLPALAAGGVGRHTITAFIGVWCLAAGCRILGELTDLPGVRARPGAASRPFAAGNLPLSQGVAMAGSLLAFAGVVAVFVLPARVLAILAAFAAVSLLQVAFVPRRPGANAIFAAVLVALRLAAGYEAVRAGSSDSRPAAVASVAAVQGSWRN